MAFRWIPMVLALTVGLSACAAAGRGDPNTIEPITTTPVTTTVAPTTDTTAHPTTTTTTTTTAPPTTTTTQTQDPQAATKQQIADLVVMARQDFLDAVYDPSNFDTSMLQQRHTEREITHTSEVIQGLRDDELFGRPAPEDLEHVTVVSVVFEDSSHAVAVACVVSNTEIVSRISGETVNDTLSAELNAYYVLLEGDSWKIDHIENLSREEDRSACSA